MSTITQKIAAILGIKSDIKDAINAKGGSLTAASPFSAYATAIANLPSQSAPQDSSYYGIVQDASLTGQASGMKNLISEVKAWPNANIAVGGFAYQTQLVSIPAISGSVDSYAFAYDASLGTDAAHPITFNAGANIGAYAFAGCTGLGKIVINTTNPQSITIDEYAFDEELGNYSPNWCETYDPSEDGDNPQSGYGQKLGNGIWFCVPDGYVQQFRAQFTGTVFADVIFNASGSDEFYHEYTDPGSGDDPGTGDDPDPIDDGGGDDPGLNPGDPDD